MKIHDRRFVVAIPTYNRSDVKIKALIDDNKDYDFIFFVRRNKNVLTCFDDYSNVSFVEIDDVTDIGNTRAAIVDRLIELGYDYCLMLDDTVSNFDKSLSDIVPADIERLEQNDLAICCTYTRRYKENRPDVFGSQICQAYLLKLHLMQTAGINFVSTSICGIEDLYFYISIVEHRLLVLTNTTCIRFSEQPCLAKRKHGTHEADTSEVDSIDRYTRQFLLLEQYVHVMHGKLPYIRFVHTKKLGRPHVYAYAVVKVIRQLYKL